MRIGSKHSRASLAKMSATHTALQARKHPEFTCSIPECGKPGFCKGWCSAHYSSNYRHGDPLMANSPEKRAAGITKMAATKRANPTRYWLGKKRGPHSAKTRAKMSASHKANGHRGRKHHLFGVLPPHRKRCLYKGIKFRSTYEVRFAKMLDRNGVQYQYEIKTFDLGDTTYTPDFYLPDYRLWCEVKGWMTPSAERKLKRFRSRYPKERLAIIPKQFFRNNLDIEVINTWPRERGRSPISGRSYLAAMLGVERCELSGTLTE